MKITVLTENTACRECLTAEHGLSLYIETGSHRILFDMGQSGAFADNAKKLGIDLAGVDFAVLSHGHNDHGGGLGRFLKENEKARVYLHPAAFQPHFNGAGQDIGLDPGLAGEQRLVFAGEGLTLAPGLTLHSVCPLAFPLDTAGLQMEENGQLVPEDFRHEQYLLIREGARRILISGCSHRGILNIMDWFRPDVLVGGFHFMKLDPANPRLPEAAARLLSYPTVYHTGHCTGLPQFAVLKGQMGERLQRFSTGTVMEL